MRNFRNVKIYTFEDLQNMKVFLNDLFQFLEVEPVAIENINHKYNVSGVPKNNFLKKRILENNALKHFLKSFIKTRGLRNKLNRMASKIKEKNLVKAEMKSETRYYLYDIFKEDIERLEDILKRDLQNWKLF